MRYWWCCLICNLCLKNPCHPRCPNYIPAKARYYCSSCGDGIYSGEEYIENQNGEYRHYECLHGMRNLLEWLGCEIRNMEEDYE